MTLACTVLLSLIALYPTVNNGWVNWDDEVYVLSNRMVQELSWENVQLMFTTPEQVGLYHPLTILSLAIDHHLYGNWAGGFHWTNLIFHLLNVSLVFLLFRRLSQHLLVATLVALLFGIHPMHVESVAWVSTRKDVLYTCFLLLSLLSYLRYRKQETRKWHWFSLSMLCFAASLLSKSLAFTLPLLLLLVDYLQHRERSWGVLLDKLPFFLLTVVAAVVAKYGQQASDSMMAITDYPLDQTIFIGTNNVVVYFYKLLVPVGLSPFHPLPFLEGVAVPRSYYWSVIPLGALAWFLWKWKTQRRWFVFGVLFFLVAIGPVLQIIPFGKAVYAERYTYVAYLGLFFVLAELIRRGLTKEEWGKGAKNGLSILLSAWLVLLAAQSFVQSKVWNSGETLWSQVIERYPEHYFGWWSRGSYRLQENRLEEAFVDLNKGIHFNPNIAEPYYDRGRVQEKLGDLQAAFNDYTLAIEKEGYAKAYVNRGRLLAANHETQAALRDFELAVLADSNYALAYLNQGIMQKVEGDRASAFMSFSRAVELEPWNGLFRRHKGVLLADMNEHEAAILEFKEASVLEPQSGEPLFLWSKSLALSGDIEGAIRQMEAAQALGYTLPEGYEVELLKLSN